MTKLHPVTLKTMVAHGDSRALDMVFKNLKANDDLVSIFADRFTKTNPLGIHSMNNILDPEEYYFHILANQPKIKTKTFSKLHSNFKKFLQDNPASFNLGTNPFSYLNYSSEADIIQNKNLPQELLKDFYDSQFKYAWLHKHKENESATADDFIKHPNLHPDILQTFLKSDDPLMRRYGLHSPKVSKVQLNHFINNETDPDIISVALKHPKADPSILLNDITKPTIKFPKTTVTTDRIIKAIANNPNTKADALHDLTLKLHQLPSTHPLYINIDDEEASFDSTPHGIKSSIIQHPNTHEETLKEILNNTDDIEDAHEHINNISRRPKLSNDMINHIRSNYPHIIYDPRYEQYNKYSPNFHLDNHEIANSI